MKSKLKKIISDLDPKLLKVDKIKITSFKKLGVGEGNLNYVFDVDNKRFICRINVDKNMPNKSLNEYAALKTVEKLDIAPKVYYLHKKDKEFPYGFIILKFIDGKAFRMKKRNYTKDQIRQLADILADLHLKKCAGLKKKGYIYSHYLSEGEYYIKKVNEYSNNKLDKELRQLNTEIKDFLPEKEDHKFALVHGDVCPQNIVATASGLKLIDWEELECSDPAKDIARVLNDLELKGNNLDLFMKSYKAQRKDKDILERAKIYAVLLRYANVMWELVRAFEVLNKELPAAYLQKTSVQEHINEAKFQFRHLRKLVNIRAIEVGALYGSMHSD